MDTTAPIAQIASARLDAGPNPCPEAIAGGRPVVVLHLFDGPLVRVRLEDGHETWAHPSELLEVKSTTTPAETIASATDMQLAQLAAHPVPDLVAKAVGASSPAALAKAIGDEVAARAAAAEAKRQAEEEEKRAREAAELERKAEAIRAAEAEQIIVDELRKKNAAMEREAFRAMVAEEVARQIAARDAAAAPVLEVVDENATPAADVDATAATEPAPAAAAPVEPIEPTPPASSKRGAARSRR